jgi:hypothetical protein
MWVTNDMYRNEQLSRHNNSRYQADMRASVRHAGCRPDRAMAALKLRWLARDEPSINVLMFQMPRLLMWKV